jgi:hypothetical protein
MTHARQFSVRMTHLQPPAAVLDAGRLVASASSVRSPTFATVAWLSIATTVWPLAGTPRCNSAPSVVSAETGFRIPLINTPGFVLAALGLWSSFRCPGVAFSVELTDLDWGSWEGSLPGSSSLGGEGKSSPRRLHLSIQASAGIQELTGGKNSINFFGIRDFSSPSVRGGLAHSGPPKWPTLSPPPAEYRGCSAVVVSEVDRSGVQR